MKRVKIADLKNQLSQHLREVEQGAEIEVTDRQRPIARLVPTPQTDTLIRIIPARRASGSSARACGGGARRDGGLMPSATVVVCTHDRAALLHRAVTGR